MNKPHKHAELIKAWADGAEIECRGGVHRQWTYCSGNPSWNEGIEYRIKPEPPKYPQTRMSDNELGTAYCGRSDGIVPRATFFIEARNLANAAIARAIQDADVVPAKVLFDAGFVHRYMEGDIANGEWIAPDTVPAAMLEKVAEAVKAECVKLHNEMSTRASQIHYAGTSFEPIESTATFWQINTAAIIASVREGATK